MLIDLINKERLINGTGKKKISRLALNWLFKAVFAGLFIALECFIYLQLDKKIEKYSSYGTFDFLVFFIFIMFIIAIVSSLFMARKALFNKDDASIMLVLPVSNEEIIFSKILFIYARQVLLSLIIATPLLISYGALRGFFPQYYVLSIIYPLFISILVVVIALTLVVPFEYLYEFIKRHDLIQFILACVVVIILCFIYKYVLELFLTALNDSTFGGAFSDSFINALHNAKLYLVPINNLLESFVNGSGNLSAVMMFLGSIILFSLIGINLTSYFFNKFNRVDFNKGSKVKKDSKKVELKIKSSFSSLLMKETDLLFKDSSYIFSYTSLLIMMPFLSFVVVSSLNSIIYQNLKIFLNMFPELTNAISLTLILLFMGVINSSATLSISREGKSLEIIKYIPIDPFKQILAKLILPTSLSSISLLISEIVLISTNSISISVFFSSLVIGLALIVASNILGVYFDMYDLSNKSKFKTKYLINLISILYPLIILFIMFLMSFLGSAGYGIYLTIVIISLVSLAPLLIKIKSRICKGFYSMEAN